MKKIMTAILLLAMLNIACAQSVDGLFCKFCREKGAEYVSSSPFSMKIANFCIDKDNEKMLMIKRISSVKILNLSDCKKDVLKRFGQDVSKINLNGYEELMSMNDGGKKVSVRIKLKKNVIRELCVMTADETDGILMHFKGEIKKKILTNL